MHWAYIGQWILTEWTHPCNHHQDQETGCWYCILSHFFFPFLYLSHSPSLSLCTIFTIYNWIAFTFSVLNILHCIPISEAVLDQYLATPLARPARAMMVLYAIHCLLLCDPFHDLPLLCSEYKLHVADSLICLLPHRFSERGHWWEIGMWEEERSQGVSSLL